MELLQTADLSVLSIVSVPPTWPVSTWDVPTHVWECVVSMPDVMLSTTIPSAAVQLDSLEILSQAVIDHQQQHQDQKLLILADLLHVESMLNVEKEMEQLHVLVYQDYLEILT